MRRVPGVWAGGLAVSMMAAHALASGILTEGFGARALGMGGAFTAVADDSTAVYWNPAGLARQRGRGLSVGLYSMSTWMDMDEGAMNVAPDMLMPEAGDVFAEVYPTEPDHLDDNDVFWPSAATAPEISGYLNRGRYTLGFGALTLGGAYSDYEGSALDATTGARVDGSIYSLFGLVDFNGSIGVRATERLDLGFGLDVLAGYLNLDVDKDYLGSSVPAQPDYRFDVESDAFGVGVQGVVGALYRIHPRVTLGAVYRSGARIRLSGETTARMALPDGVAANDLEEESDHETRFRFPPTWGVGVAWRPTDRLLLSLDWQGADWTRFYWPAGRIEYDDEGLLLRSVNRDPGWFSDSMYRAGAEYRASERWTWRAGYYREDTGGFPAAFEDITYTVSGENQIVNLGVSRHWREWTGDFLVGTMWGARDNEMEHRCLTLAVGFRRSFGG